MKITGATKVSELTGFIADNIEFVKTHSEELYNDILEANKKAKEKKLTKKELVALATLVSNLIEIETKKEKEQVANSVKPKGGKNAPKNEEAVKESANEEVTPVRTVQTQELVLAKMFPKEIEVEGETYKVATNINNMEALKKAYEKGAEVVIAVYWTERHLKQFQYGIPEIHQDVKKFKDDLDLAQTIYLADDGKVLYAVSVYTDNCYTILGSEIPQYEGLRFFNGAEYQIYVK